MRWKLREKMEDGDNGLNEEDIKALTDTQLTDAAFSDLGEDSEQAEAMTARRVGQAKVEAYRFSQIRHSVYRWRLINPS